MKDTVNDAPVAASCDYCGRKNPDCLPACPSCGTPLTTAPPSADSEAKGKSKVLAVCLALIFGPLGLLYVRAWGTAFVMVLIAVPFILTHKGGLWLTVGGRLICAAWAYCALIERDEAPNSGRDSLRLLDEAARLESVNQAKAIATYEEIIRLYNGTPASREAERNLQILKRQT